MPSLNWDAFVQLPGAPETNFEMLCRMLIRRHYESRGVFAARAAQPGVEFHLKLNKDCSLGEAGGWWGWQCRWYDLPQGNALGTSRRQKIIKAIATTTRELPNLTDWVLWTRRPLTKGDQEWFYRIDTPMTLRLWTGAEVEEHLSGEAEIFRRTYFGELVLTPEILSSLHQEAVAPIRQRWRPELHQVLEAEREIRRILGETVGWDILQTLADQLSADVASIDLSASPSSQASLIAEAIQLSETFADALSQMHRALDIGDLDRLSEIHASRSALPGPSLATLPRKLRAKRHPIALPITNAIADARRAHKLMDEVCSELNERIIGVVADAGCGKTELAAQLTAATDDWPAGILLHGRDLHAGHSVDDLAQRVIIQGVPVPTMEALVAAVDAAGRRCGRRLPIVIDGLNEAEDARDWKTSLAILCEKLHQYPYAFVVCTLRGAFVEEALPEDVEQIEIPDFADDTIAAIRRYFDYYRIDAYDAELPIGLLRHPLTLRLFCEVTNPERKKRVGVEAMPGSLSALFDKYLEQAAKRIAELAPRAQRYYESDIRGAIDTFGIMLWDENARYIEQAVLRTQLGDEGRPWNESIIRALEHEGVVLRFPGDTPGATRVAVVYDALAGHIVADAILARYGRNQLPQWLRDPANLAALTGPREQKHPLGTDTFHALIALAPRRSHQIQLWTLLDEPFRIVAVRRAADLEAAYIDADTVSELAALVEQTAEGTRDLFARLRETRGASDHPLNAEFLDNALRAMTIAGRDLRWSEWLRRNKDDVIADIKRLEERWRNSSKRTVADQLRARWIMWTLTSTVRDLRDHATCALYWFGRRDPGALFYLILGSLEINDAYISERMLAAGYGVAMAHQLPSLEFREHFAAYLQGLCSALTKPNATSPTNHWLARLYAEGTITLARTFYSDLVPQTLEGTIRIPFAAAPAAEPLARDDPRGEGVDRALGMDFANYTIGRLIDDRAPYDFDHGEYKAAAAGIRGRIWNLGWRQSLFDPIDRQIGSTDFSYRAEKPGTERYGKKYGWIGYYDYAGLLCDKGRFPAETSRLSDLGVDPSFPNPPPQAPIPMPTWIRQTPKDDRRWVRHGVITVPDTLLYAPELGPDAGPWICVNANLHTAGSSPGRRVNGFLHALLVSPNDANHLLDALKAGNYQIESSFHWVPSDHYTFAGEIPWSPEFGADWRRDFDPAIYHREIRTIDGRSVEVEILSHRYEWEGYHSSLNSAGGVPVPSKSFSNAFDLRGMPQMLHQVSQDGSTVTMSFQAPSGFGGNMLYLREDLLHRYASGRELIWLIEGERQLRLHGYAYPKWYERVMQERADAWHYARNAGELSTVFAENS